ncbi:MAG: glycosyltransferase family 2 protein [Nocardioides sp.]
MRFGRRRTPLVSVVVPVYDVEAYLPACLDSALASTHRHLEVVVVDDGSPDGSGAIADAYAARDPRVRVVHTDNHGLGAARNEGLRHVSGDYVTFLDSDDVVPPEAWTTLVGSLERSGSDLATGSIVRWESDGLHEPPWMRRLHATRRTGIGIGEHPELLGDVFAWNKVFRRSFWEAEALAWPEGLRYEDQPTTTRAFLAGRLDVLPEVVYHWRIRDDGTSITQQRSSLRDLADRWETKRMSLRSVLEHGDPHVTEVFRDRVLAGDLHRYFTEIPGCPDDWWELLRAGVQELWGDRSLTHSGLPPVHRLTGWLVEQGRREDAAAVMTYAAGLGRPLDRVVDDEGPRLDVPVVDVTTVERAALAVRSFEV